MKKIITGRNFILGFIAGFLIVLVIGIFYYYGLSLETKMSVNIFQSKASPTVADKYGNWKTFFSDKYGLKFRYPADMIIRVRNDTDHQYLIAMESQNQQYGFEVAFAGKGYSKYPPYSGPNGTKIFGNLTWEIIPAGSFGDAGQVATYPAMYHINHGDYRYDFNINKPDHSTPNYEAMISSFEFTK